MVSYEIEKQDNKIILTPEPEATYTNKSTGMQFYQTYQGILYKPANPKAKPRQISTLTLQKIIIPQNESPQNMGNIQLVFQTRNHTNTILDINMETFDEDINDFINPCYIDILHDYFKMFIHTVLMDVYSKKLSSHPNKGSE